MTSKFQVISIINDCVKNPDKSYVRLDEDFVDVIADKICNKVNETGVHDDIRDYKEYINEIIVDSHNDHMDETIDSGLLEDLVEDIVTVLSDVLYKSEHRNDPFKRIPEFLVMHAPSDNPKPEKLILSAKLIFEELLEYAEACDLDTQAAILDEFQDMLDKENDKYEDIDYGIIDRAKGLERQYNRVAMFDAQIDILYVLANAAYHCNLHGYMLKGFMEVHANNASKCMLSNQEVQDIFEHYDNEELTRHSIIASTAQWVTNNYGKIMKIPNHPKPNLEKVLGINTNKDEDTIG